MSIFWNLPAIARHMRAQGITTQQELNRRAGLSRLTMYNITRSGPLTRVDVPTLCALTKVFKLESPWPLLEYIPDE